ncbi:MAG: DUF1761 domain-containing protein [Xanthomonadaceae bacterium]|nr:DUF1761 domain-containing protein [Xanthomonadaceae bacterium]
MDFSHVNFGAVLVAAISAFALGGVWYGVFSKAWIEASGVSPEKQAAMGKGHSAMVFGVSFLLSVAAAFVFTGRSTAATTSASSCCTGWCSASGTEAGDRFRRRRCSTKCGNGSRARRPTRAQAGEQPAPRDPARRPAA